MAPISTGATTGSHSSGSSVASLDMQDEGQDGEDDEGVLMRLGTGVLFGLNNNTPDTTLKVSLEAEF